MMNIEIGLFSRGITHAHRVYRYDDMMGCMVRGFSARALGVFVCVVWRTRR